MDSMQWRSEAECRPAVAYLGYGRHGSCHGRHFDGGAKGAWQKSKFKTCSFFNLCCAPHTTINCTAASIQRHYNAIIWVCCVSTKHCEKTGIVTQHNGQTLRQNKNAPLQYLVLDSSYKQGFASQFVVMRFRQEDVGQNVVVTSLSQCL